MYTLQSGLQFAQPVGLDQPNLVMAGVDHRVPPDHRRAARLPAPARAGPDRRRREGMTRRSPSPWSARSPRARRRGRLRVGRVDPPGRQRPRPRPRRRPNQVRRRPRHRARRSLRRHRRRSPRRRRRRCRRCRRARSTALATATAPVEITFWHGLGSNARGGVLTALTDEYNASPDARSTSTWRTRAATSRRSTSTCRAARTAGPTWSMLPEYMVQQMADSGTAIPIGACIEAERLRRLAVPAPGDAGVLDRGRAVGDAVQRQRPGPLLQRGRLPERRAGRHRPAGHDRRAAGGVTGDRRHRRRRHGDRPRQRRRLRRRLVPRAVVRPGRGGRTPTTATAVWPRRPRCCTPGRSASTS